MHTHSSLLGCAATAPPTGRWSVFETPGRAWPVVHMPDSKVVGEAGERVHNHLSRVRRPIRSTRFNDGAQRNQCGHSVDALDGSRWARTWQYRLRCHAADGQKDGATNGTAVARASSRNPGKRKWVIPPPPPPRARAMMGPVVCDQGRQARRKTQASKVIGTKKATIYLSGSSMNGLKHPNNKVPVYSRGPLSPSWSAKWPYATNELTAWR